MKNPFRNRMPSVNGPATDIVPVTPSDSEDLEEMAMSLYVESGGDVTVVTYENKERTVKVEDFTILPVVCRQVKDSGTTAMGIHALVVT